MPWLFVCLFIVECGYAVSVGIVLQKNRTEPSTEIWGQKPIETDRKRKIPHRNNTISKALEKSKMAISTGIYLSRLNRRSWTVTSSCISHECSFLKPCWYADKILLWSKCCLMWEVMICSKILRLTFFVRNEVRRVRIATPSANLIASTLPPGCQKCWLCSVDCLLSVFYCQHS